MKEKEALTTELEAIPELANVGIALVQFAESLFPSCTFNKKTNRWVAEPNFVTFEIHSSRTKNITLSLRGNPNEFNQHDSLPLRKGMAGYSGCTLKHPGQLATAASYIARAAEIYRRGRTRVKKSPVSSEQDL